MPMAERESDDHALLRFRKMSRPARVVYARPRTFIAVAIGIVAFFLLPDSLRLVTRLLMSWDGFFTVYLTLVYIMLFRCVVSHIRRTALLQVDDRILVQLVPGLGSFVCVSTIVF